MEKEQLKIITIDKDNPPRLVATYDDVSSPLELNWTAFLGNNMLWVGEDDDGVGVYAVPMKQYFKGFLLYPKDVFVPETDHTAWALVNVRGHVTPEAPIKSSSLVYWHGDTWDGDIGHLPEEVRKI